MQIHNRPFDEKQNDFRAMSDFLVDDRADRKEGFVWHPGRLGDWHYGLWSARKYFPSFRRKNAQLWLDDLGELKGFIISENCSNDFAVFVRKGHEFLYPEMLEWVKVNWAGRGAELTTEVHEHQTGYMEVLKSAGFVEEAPIAITWQYSVADKATEAVVLNEGFRIEDMLANPDYAGKKRLHNNGFMDRNDPVSEFDLLQFEYSRENPCYYPNFDLSVVHESGLHVSTCTAFIDWKNGVAEIEKVCTDSNFRKRGLAKAVIRECFRRLHAEGIEWAYITGYSTEAKSVYGKLGAVKSKQWYSYTWSR